MKNTTQTTAPPRPARIFVHTSLSSARDGGRVSLAAEPVERVRELLGAAATDLEKHLGRSDLAWMLNGLADALTGRPADEWAPDEEELGLPYSTGRDLAAFRP